MARKDLKYVTLVDFTQGIYSKYAASTQLNKDGSAQESYNGRYTYGCYGDPDGGLRPGPRFFKTFTTDINEHAFTQTDANEYNYWNLTNTEDKVAIVDFTVVSPMYSTTEENTSGLIPGDPGPFPNEDNDSWEDSGFWKSYPEATRHTPDMLFALTSHRFTRFTDFIKTSGILAGTTTGQHHPDAGALVGQFKQWSVCRMPDGQTNLTLVERQLQCRVAVAEWGDRLAWEQIETSRGDQNTDESLGTLYNRGHLTGVVNYAVSEDDAWHGGNIAVGRSVYAWDEGDSVSFTDLNRPGGVAVAACMFSGFRVGEAAGWIAGFPNFFSVFGVGADEPITLGSVNQPSQISPPPVVVGSNPTAPGFGTTPPYWQSESNFAFPNYEWQQAIWTWAQIPRYIIEHQDRVVGVIGNNAAGGLESRLADRFSPDGQPGTSSVNSQYGFNSYGEPNEWIRYSFPNAWVTPDYLMYDAGSPAGEDLKLKQNIWSRYDEFTPIQSTFGSNKNPSNIGVICSWAGEMLIVKWRGGGVLVRGSLDDGQAIPLPNVPSTNGLNCIPAFTELGVVYGTADGAALWSGGTEIRNISPQLNGWFWNVGAESGVGRFNEGRRKNGIAGRFNYSYPFVYAPNDWIMDVRTGGWFRLIDPATDTNPYKHMFYSTNSYGKVYACRGCYDENNLDIIDIYDSYERTSDYQWVSQPIIQSMVNEVDADEIILTAQGRGQVTIILTGIDGQEIEEAFDINSPDRPYRIARNTHVRASELVVTIKSEGANVGEDQVEAPVVHMLNIGLSEANGLMRD